MRKYLPPCLANQRQAQKCGKMLRRNTLAFSFWRRRAKRTPMENFEASGPSADSAPAILNDSAKPARLSKIGILLVNLGTPDTPRFWAVRRFLKEFLSDRRVIEKPRVFWWPLLHFIILSLRPGRAAKQYAAIWNKGSSEGPLKAITRSQAEKLAAWVGAGGLDPIGHHVAHDRFFIAWAMRYGKPSIAQGIRSLSEQGCARILVVPFYPQYAAATGASVNDKVFEAVRAMRWQPAVRIAPPYFDDPSYIDLVATSVRARLARLDFIPETILVSFHGLPQASTVKGDPYHEQCLETWRLLREDLKLSAAECPVSFQSRFGSGEWLKPYTAEEVKRLAKQGAKRLVVVTPGFAADCLETLYEIGIECREIFLKNGGESFALVPCLNDSELGMMLVYEMVARELKGWV
jgi:protoporphyrin/coproporphyrin ferrochelatase